MTCSVILLQKYIYMIVKEKVSESDSVPLWDGTTSRRLLAECKLLESA